MDDIGAEVSQKMRSAVKAKLMELDCYVDDELPDYIMVMVANKRTKSQMNEDLQLFLSTKTSTFVDWLHIVLKKLKEVHVTNPDVYSKAIKRKSDEVPANVKVKKEKKEKKSKKQKDSLVDSPKKSLTDDLPITANKLSEVRKIIVMQANDQNNAIIDDGFDIPLLSEVNFSNEKELQMLEKRIKNVKTRLGIQVDSESEDEDFIDIKAEPEELFPNERGQDKKQRKVVVQTGSKPEIQLANSNNDTSTKQLNNNDNNNAKVKHARITFDANDSPKKLSVLERLGKRNSVVAAELFEPKKTNAPHLHREKSRSPVKVLKNKSSKDRILQFEKPRESILSRLGVMSKVAIPEKPKEAPPVVEEVEEPEEKVVKEVPSVVKVKPRMLPPNAKQANKTLLLRAVADAQRSVAQTPNVGNNVDKSSFFTKKKPESPQTSNKTPKRKLLAAEKKKLQKIIVHIARDELKVDENQEYVPQPIRTTIVNRNVTYVPTVKAKELEKSPTRAPAAAPVLNQKFIVTLDGIDKEKFLKKDEEPVQAKKPPSPIIFDKLEADSTSKTKSNIHIPDTLPVVSAVPLKNKERCKYWPLCKQGDKCEFVHPTIPCKMFPSCKFGEKCAYIHPTCKFEASCTKRDCPYSHTSTNKVVTSRIVPPASTKPAAKQTCKYFPNCTNVHCAFYHPKSCKFGKFCKNQSDCNFAHSYTVKSANLTWKSNKV